MTDIVKIEGQADFDALEGALKKLDANIRRLREQIAIDSRLDVDTSAAEAELEKLTKVAGELKEEIGEVSDESKGFGDIAKTAFGNIAANAVAKVTELALEAAAAIGEAAARVEELNNRAEQLGNTPEEARERLARLREVSADLGADVALLSDAALTAEKRLQGLGIEGGLAADTVDRLASVSVAAEGRTEDFADTVGALGQSLKAGRFDLAAFLDDLERRLPGASSVAAEALGVSEEKLKDFTELSGETASEVLPALATAFEQAFGDSVTQRIEQSQGSIAGTKAELAALRDQIAEELLPAIQEVLTGVTDFIDSGAGQALIDIVVGLTSAIGPLVGALGDLVSFDIGNVIRRGALALTEFTQSANDAFGSLTGMQDGLANSEILLESFAESLRESIDATRESADATEEASEREQRAQRARTKAAEDAAKAIRKAAREEVEVRVRAARESVQAFRDASSDELEARRDARDAAIKEAERAVAGIAEAEREGFQQRIEAIKEAGEETVEAERDLVDQRIEQFDRLLEAAKDSAKELREVRVEAAEAELEAVKEANEELEGEEREFNEVRIKLREDALEQIAEAEEKAAEAAKKAAEERIKAQEEAFERLRDAVEGLGDDFADIFDADDGLGISGGADEATESIKDLKEEIESLIEEQERLQDTPVISEEDAQRLQELINLIPGLQSELSSLGASRPLEPLNEDLDQLGEKFRETISAAIADGGNLEEVLLQLSPAGREGIGALVTEFAAVSEQAGLTKDEIRDVGETIIDRLKSEGIPVPKELAEAFGVAADDIGSSASDIANRLNEIDAAAREAQAGADTASTAMDSVTESATAASEATSGVATEIERINTALLALVEANPSETLTQIVSALTSNPEALQAVAEGFTGVSTALASVVESGPGASEALTAIVTAATQAVESGSIESLSTGQQAFADALVATVSPAGEVGEAIEEIGGQADTLAESLPSAKEALESLVPEGLAKELGTLIERLEDVSKASKNVTTDANEAAKATGELSQAQTEASESAGEHNTELEAQAEAIGALAEPRSGYLTSLKDEKKALEDVASQLPEIVELYGQVRTAVTAVGAAADAAREKVAALNEELANVEVP